MKTGNNKISDDVLNLETTIENLKSENKWLKEQIKELEEDKKVTKRVMNMALHPELRSY